jgi:L-cysteine desulfidase
MYFCGIHSKYTMPCVIMIYATLDALMGHASVTTYHTLGGYDTVQMSG